MEGQALANRVMDMTTHMMDVADDVVVAIIKALSNKATKEEQGVIKAFTKYMKEGGKLRTVSLNKDALTAIKEYADKDDLMYLAIKTDGTDKTVVLFREEDEERVRDILKEMEKDGVQFDKNPQLEFEDYAYKYANENSTDFQASSQYAFTKSEYDMHKANLKELMAEANVEYAIREGDDTITMYYPKAQDDIVKAMDFIDSARVTNVIDKKSVKTVKNDVGAARKAQEQEKEQAKEKKKSKGMEM